MGMFYTCSIFGKYGIFLLLITYNEGFPFANKIIIFMTQSHGHFEKKKDD